MLIALNPDVSINGVKAPKGYRFYLFNGKGVLPGNKVVGDQNFFDERFFIVGKESSDSIALSIVSEKEFGDFTNNKTLEYFLGKDELFQKNFMIPLEEERKELAKLRKMVTDNEEELNTLLKKKSDMNVELLKLSQDFEKIKKCNEVYLAKQKKDIELSKSKIDKMESLIGSTLFKFIFNKFL